MKSAGRSHTSAVSPRHQALCYKRINVEIIASVLKKSLNLRYGKVETGATVSFTNSFQCCLTRFCNFVGWKKLRSGKGTDMANYISWWCVLIAALYVIWISTKSEATPYPGGWGGWKV